MNLMDIDHLSNKNLNDRTATFRRRKLFRTISTLSGAALCSFSSLTFGLGLGEIQSTSFIGQPLRANIALVSLDGDIDLSRLIVRQVPSDEAAKLGVELISTLNHFEFRLDNSKGVPFVAIESREAIKEPYLNLLVELRWPNGVVYREYPVLLDPPPKAPVVSAKQVAPAADLTRSPIPVVTPRKPKSAEAPAPIVAARQLKLDPLATSEGKYRVKSGDTLSKIAERWREGTDRGIYDTMQWLHENNLNAFTNQNIDMLRAGAVLQMPDLSAYAVDNQVPTKEEQNKAVQIKEPTAGAVKPASTEELDKQSRDSVRHVDLEQNATSRGLLTVGTANQDDNTRELIDMLVRENESLRARMEKVENSEYLETLKQLIILQRQQISELRTRIGVSDTDNNQEIDALLERIGIDNGNRKPESQIEAILKSEELTVDQQADDVQVELASENVVAKKDLEDTLAPVKVDPVLSAPIMANKTEKTWLIWLVLGGSAAIISAFAGLFIYYRRTVSGADTYVSRHDDEEEDDLFGSLVDDEAPAGVNQPAGRRRTPVVSEQEDLSKGIDYDSDEPQVVYRSKGLNEDQWLGDTAEISEDDLMDMDAAMREVQEAFDDLLLDESVLSELEKESSLEAFTEELPAPEMSKVDKGPRRTDDELKMSIAEKMAQYNPEEYRQEIENLGLMELDELANFEDEQDDIDTAVYRAMMFCEFKKFSKARELIQSMLDVGQDERLTSALEQIDGMEGAVKNGTKQAG